MRVCYTPGCPTQTTGTYCQVHQKVADRKHNAARGALYQQGWPAEARRLRDAEPWCHNVVDPRPCHGVLTVDHPTRLAYCQRHHSAMEARRRRAQRESITA